MITYLIIDDEYIAHDIIEGYCEQLGGFKLMKSCYDAFEALEYLRAHEVDLIFLDLNMPRLKGFDFLRTLQNPPKVIVSSAYKEYALEGYELNVSDYLLKPFSFERFLKAINKTFNSPPVSATPQEKTPEQIFIRSQKKHIQLTIDNILFLEAAGNYTKIACEEETLTVREKISEVFSLLPASRFIQVHKSFVVAVRHIKSVEGNVLQVQGQEIPVGKLYKANVSRLWT